MMTKHEQSLHGRFLASAERHGDRVALEVGGESITYAELRARALRVASTMLRERDGSGPALTATLVGRSAAGFAAILAALCSGHGYVPLLPSWPAARLASLLDRSEVRCLIVDDAGARTLDAVLDAVARPLLVISLANEIEPALAGRHPRHRFVEVGELDPAAVDRLPPVGPDDLAYLLFTSGSTGEPKGVMVAHRNVARFLDVVIARYGLGPEDRFSHLFEITFDLSVFDLFAAWSVGGCVCVPDDRQRLLPHRYAIDAKLSVWFSVPSAVLLLEQMQALRPGMFGDLRLVLFCGEALPASLARSFAAAAPAARLENIYGPTELTLACTAYRWTGSLDEGEQGVVPIGEPFPGMRARVVDAELGEVAPGQTGELLMAGPQVTLGYWRDPERTATAFVRPPGEAETFYRTGDSVRRPRPGEPMTFLGRLDSQIKINGYRVELGEIEAVLCREAPIAAAVALGWPPTPAGAAGVVAFVTGTTDGFDAESLLARLDELLPRYMVPQAIHPLDRFPLNQNGKIDRKALLARLEAASREHI